MPCFTDANGRPVIYWMGTVQYLAWKQRVGCGEGLGRKDEVGEAAGWDIK